MKTRKAVLMMLMLLLCTTIQAQDSVFFSGTIHDPVGDSVVATYSASKLAYYPVYYKAATDAAGNFSMKFPVPGKVFTQAEMRYANTTTDLILQAGDSLVMTTDTKRFDSAMHYKGRGSAVQNFLVAHLHNFGRYNQYSVSIRKFMNDAPDRFESGIDSVLQSENGFLNDNKKGLPPAFCNYWRAFFQYYNYYFTEQYPAVHEMAKKRRFTDTIPATSYEPVQKMPLIFYDSLLQVPSYLMYLSGALEAKMKAEGYVFYLADTAGVQRFQDSVLKRSWKDMPGACAEYFMAQFMYSKIRYRAMSVSENQLQQFRHRWPKSDYLTTLQDQLDLVARISPGVAAPDLLLHTLDGHAIKLADLKGKVVYVNFWSTQCRPCFADMVSEEKLNPLMKDKSLVYVHISIDNDTATMNRLLKRYQLSGIFAYLTGGWYAPEVQQFGVQSLPAYYLIDEDGKFALLNPPNPNQTTDLILAIGKLLK